MASVDYGALTPVEGSVGDHFGDKDVDGGSEVFLHRLILLTFGRW